VDFDEERFYGEIFEEQEWKVILRSKSTVHAKDEPKI
jgi:hypothetical protein